MIEIKITKIDAGQRSDKYLQKMLPKMPKSLLYKMFRKKNIKLNGGKVVGNEILEAGDRLALYFADEALDNFGYFQEQSDVAASINLDIIYEDSKLLLVNKPAGVPAQPGSKETSIVEAIDGYLAEKLGDKKGGFRAGICNRLDMNTSGLVMSGKTVTVLQDLNEMVAEHKVNKIYHCILAGELKENLDLKGGTGKRR